MKKTTLLVLFIFSNYYLLIAQPLIQWQKSLGGTDDDIANAIQQTSDGGYIVVGNSRSNDSDVTGNHGFKDYWIVKLNNVGSIQWQKSLGGTNDDFANSVQQTTDGGYVVAGNSRSNDNDVTGNHGIYDYWVVKLDTGGSIQWQKCLGGTSNEEAYSIKKTTDGGYIIAGLSNSTDGDVTGNHGGNDYWIVKLDSGGTIHWQKSLGGSFNDVAYSIQQTKDGGYIVAGTSDSYDGDVTGAHGISDFWIVKLDSSGSIEWKKNLGGSSYDGAYSIQQTIDGGYVVTGESGSSDGDVTGNHGGNDYWVVKLDSSGFIKWQKCLGGTSYEIAYSIQQTTDRGYIIAGISYSNDGDVTGNHGYDDYWIVKLDSGGTIQWQKCMGGSYGEFVRFIQQTTDGGYVIAGYSNSNDGDVTGFHGISYNDYWIVKLSSTVDVNDIQNPILSFKTIPNPFSNITTLSFQISLTDLIYIEIHDIEGRLIKNLHYNNFIIGSNEVIWDATNNSGAKVDYGLYFITLTSNNFSETKKVVVMKE